MEAKIEELLKSAEQNQKEIDQSRTSDGAGIIDRLRRGVDERDIIARSRCLSLMTMESDVCGFAKTPQTPHVSSPPTT